MLNEGVWERVADGGAFGSPGVMLDAIETDGHSAIVVGDTTGPEFEGDADAAVWIVNLEGRD